MTRHPDLSDPELGATSLGTLDAALARVEMERERMRRFREWSPAMADHYERAQKAVGECHREFARALLETSCARIAVHARSLRDNFERAALEWAIAREGFRKFVEQDFPRDRSSMGYSEDESSVRVDFFKMRVGSTA